MILLAQSGYAATSGVFQLTWLLVALPAASATLLLGGGGRTKPWGHLLGCAARVAAFLIGRVEFFALAGRDGGESGQIDQHLFPWIPVSGFHVDVNLLLDPL